MQNREKSMRLALKGRYNLLAIIVLLAAASAMGGCKHVEKLTGPARMQELQAENAALKAQLDSIHRKDSVVSALNSSIRQSLKGFNAEDLSIVEKNGKVYVVFSDKFLFKSGSVLVNYTGRKALKQLAEVLNQNQDIDIIVEGHTDNLPINNTQYYDNWELSAARAASVVRILSQEFNVEPARLSAAGRGEFHPIAANDTPEGRAKNRRIEIILTPKI